MRKLLIAFQEWKQRRKDKKGKYLIAYVDQQLETSHKFRFADLKRALKAFDFLVSIAKHANSSKGFIIDIFENGAILQHYEGR